MYVTYQEVIIETYFTGGKRFVRCSNSDCQIIFEINLSEIKNDREPLCKSCTKEQEVSHVVQCSCCNAIVTFIKADEDEEPIVFHVKKCSNCHGSIEDEINIQPSYFPEAYV